MIKNHIAYNPIMDWKFRVSKAEGSFLWDEKGHRVIDFTSGWNTANLGWNNVEISEAMAKQIQKNTYVPSWISDEIQEEYAVMLVSTLPKQLNTVCRVTSGTEANEQAIKIARTVTGRKKIIGFQDTYHGSTYASISIGYRPEYVKDLSPVVGDFIHMEYPAVAPGTSEEALLQNFLVKLEDVIRNKDVAAILTEAGIITGWGSMHVAPKGFLKAVRSLTQQYGTLLILDEVGTGFSRCGRLFAHQIEDVIPDLLTLAKAMTNGVAAMGACIVNDNLISHVIPKTKLLSSLAWMPIGCAAAKKVLEVHLRDKLWEKAETNGQWLLSEIVKKIPQATYVRGKGLEIGIDFKSDEKEHTHVTFVENIVNIAFTKGLQILQSDEATIQLMPPLITQSKVLEEGLDILVASVQEAERKI